MKKNKCCLLCQSDGTAEDGGQTFDAIVEQLADKKTSFADFLKRYQKYQEHHNNSVGDHGKKFCLKVVDLNKERTCNEK